MSPVRRVPEGRLEYSNGLGASLLFASNGVRYWNLAPKRHGVIGAIGILSSLTYLLLLVVSIANLSIHNGCLSTDDSSGSSGPAPTVTTSPAITITYNSAVLNGLVNPNGFNTTCYFEYGISTTPITYPLSTTPQAIGNGTSDIAITNTVSGLASNTPYNFRVAASNAGGTTNGNNQTFTTAEPPAVDDYCWVANRGSANVTRITKSTSATATITAGTAPYGVAVDVIYCWVANVNSNNVTRIVKSTLASTTIAVGAAPAGIAVDGTYCWVANNGSNNVTRITKADLTTTTIAVGTGPNSLGDMAGYAYDNYSTKP